MSHANVPGNLISSDSLIYIHSLEKIGMRFFNPASIAFSASLVCIMLAFHTLM